MIYILYTILCVSCLCIGYFLGTLKDNKQPVKKIDVISPIEKVKKNRENKELEEENKRQLERYSTILDNINNYDGSGNNQRKVN